MTSLLDDYEKLINDYNNDTGKITMTFQEYVAKKEWIKLMANKFRCLEIDIKYRLITLFAISSNKERFDIFAKDFGIDANTNIRQFNNFNYITRCPKCDKILHMTINGQFQITNNSITFDMKNYCDMCFK
jgi:hypothetical protein